MRKFTRSSGVNCEKKQVLVVKKEDGRYNPVKIMSKDGKPLWTTLLEYISTFKIDDIITRKQILNATYKKEVVEHLNLIGTSVDTYLIYLRKLEIIKQEYRGRYRKIVNIPPDTTISTVRSILKDKQSWRGWFQPIHKRLGITKENIEE